MAKRSYGSGSIFIQGDKWCGRWWVGDRRVKRMLGPVRKPGSRDGLTRSQAERELRRRMESELPSVSRHERPTIGDAGSRYVDHLEHVMERKRSRSRTTVATCAATWIPTSPTGRSTASIPIKSPAT